MLSGSLAALVLPLLALHPGLSGLYVLDRGEDALVARVWMVEHASHSIEAQTFIWTSDHVGILASESLLRAAERGVKVRVIVDDLMVDAPEEQLLFLAGRENIDIRVYNPNLTVGTGRAKRLWNALTGLRAVNQRMHDKTFIVDGAAALTGGRNVADEYYDFDHAYNFRDRDLLVLGPAVSDMRANFERFWADPRSVPVEKALAGRALSPERARALRAELAAYAGSAGNFSPEVRAAVAGVPRRFPELVDGLTWAKARFLGDDPGKNPGREGLKGGGAVTSALLEAAEGAKERLTIQSPYCVLTERGLELLSGLVKKGVTVRILTNSLAASDNLQASSGYMKQRSRLLAAGIQLFEFRPDAAVSSRLMGPDRPKTAKPPVFAVHAKTMVVDGKTLFVGTFNLDPRSAHLNTEAGILVTHPGLAARVEKDIEEDMSPGSAWKAGEGDSAAPRGHRLKAFLWGLLPLDPLL
ncbi:MAG: phospholipase D family protein [Elusimicrobia bacterium]|nr:phospholipase D family protein [Elusimicrobiota bacterium]